MQTIAVYGRLFARAIFTGLNAEHPSKLPEPYHLLTGASGFSKSPLGASKPGVKNWTFGDDAYFIAKDDYADVIGMIYIQI